MRWVAPGCACEEEEIESSDSGASATSSRRARVPVEGQRRRTERQSRTGMRLFFLHFDDWRIKILGP